MAPRTSRQERLAYRTSGQRQKAKKQHWRASVDALFPPLLSLGSPSLCPGPSLIERYVERDPIALAIIQAWAPCFTVTREVAA